MFKSFEADVLLINLYYHNNLCTLFSRVDAKGVGECSSLHHSTVCYNAVYNIVLSGSSVFQCNTMLHSSEILCITILRHSGA
jgi:hypothetical protein